MSRFDALAVPLLAPRAQARHRADEFVVETPDATLSFAGASATVLAAIYPHLDGRHRLDELASGAGVALPQLAAVLATLAEETLVLDAEALLRAEGCEELLSAYWRECEFWVGELLAQPFWQTVLSGRAPRSVVLGWGIEFRHYVDAANEHMALSVAHCRDDAVSRLLLAHHYVEEAHHGVIFLGGLAEDGLDPARVVQAPTLPSTRALIDYLDELAISDTLAYAATFGVMQQSREPKASEAVNRFYDSLTELYPFARGMFDGFRRHALVDVDLKHHDLVFEKICRRRRDLSQETRSRVLHAVRSVAQHFMLFFETILDSYAAADAPLPRRPLDIRNFL